MFSRVEQGETIEVTRHGKVIAVLLPRSGALSRYAPLISRGLIKISATTTDDLAELPTFEVLGDRSPLDLLLAERDEDTR